MDGRFPNIFHGEHRELREKFGLVIVPPADERSKVIAARSNDLREAL